MQTSGFNSNNFYEAERSSIKLSHNDFAAEQEFDYIQENTDLNEYLLDKNWDSYFIKPGPYARRTCETSIANKIFDKVFEEFKFRMDTVQMFHVITDFYDINAAWYFSKLVKTYRQRLKKDLTTRIGRLRNSTGPTVICEEKIRNTFTSLFNKK